MLSRRNLIPHRTQDTYFKWFDRTHLYLTLKLGIDHIKVHIVLFQFVHYIERSIVPRVIFVRIKRS